jgi:hypothetical protein
MMLASLCSQGGLEDGRAGDFVSPLLVLFVPKAQNYSSISIGKAQRLQPLMFRRH